MKPIELGCLAWFRGGEHPVLGWASGAEVEVVALEPRNGGTECRLCGREFIWLCSGMPKPFTRACECTLTRIDGFDGEDGGVVGRSKEAEEAW